MISKTIPIEIYKTKHKKILFWKTILDAVTDKVCGDSRFEEREIDTYKQQILN